MLFASISPFDKLREMEIINGIKFHAIISFDFFSHFCFMFVSSTKRGKREEAESSNKDILKCASQMPLERLFLLFFFEHLKSQFYSFS